jgi:hypothetical protein
VGLTLAANRNAQNGAGLPIHAVAAGSDAEAAGIEAGDLLLSLDRNPAFDLIEVRRILRGLRAGDPLLIEVQRGERRFGVETRVSEYPVESHAGASTSLSEVEYEGRRLRTIAVLPDTAPPHPLVYYLPGAHWASEEHPLDLEHPLPALVGALASAGIATLRVERSGVGDSEGPPCTRLDFASELGGYRAGLEWALEQSWVARERVFLFGHSLGAMVAPLLAQAARVAGILTYGASAIPISEGLVGALLRHAARDPRQDPASAARTALICELVRLVVAGQTPAQVYATRPDLERIAPAHFSADQAYHRVAAFYHQLERQELVRAWGRVACPVLALHGELDYISTWDDSCAIASAAGETARAQALPHADHQMSAGGARLRLAHAVGTASIEWLRSW